MRLMYLPANAAFAFVSGDNLSTAWIVNLDGQRFFKTRSAAVAAAEQKGLRVLYNGVVETVEEVAR